MVVVVGVVVVIIEAVATPLFGKASTVDGFLWRRKWPLL